MQLLSPEYLNQSARPLTSLIFVAPILVAYEIGIVALGPTAMRNGADMWLRSLLDAMGFGQYFLLPLLTCFVLAALHHLARQAWSISADTLSRMFSETTVLAFLLLLISQLAVLLPETLRGGLVVAAVEPQNSGLPRLVGFLGAGIYEEVLFRLMLLPLLAALLRRFGESHAASLRGAAVASSLIFAAAHYSMFTGVGEDLQLWSFLFRFAAGMVFATIFLRRGFGIAAGTHTLYDLIVGLLQ